MAELQRNLQFGHFPLPQTRFASFASDPICFLCLRPDLVPLPQIQFGSSASDPRLSHLWIQQPSCRFILVGTGELGGNSIGCGLWGGLNWLM